MRTAPGTPFSETFKSSPQIFLIFFYYSITFIFLFFLLILLYFLSFYKIIDPIIFSIIYSIISSQSFLLNHFLLNKIYFILIFSIFFFEFQFHDSFIKTHYSKLCILYLMGILKSFFKNFNCIIHLK